MAASKELKVIDLNEVENEINLQNKKVEEQELREHLVRLKA